MKRLIALLVVLVIVGSYSAASADPSFGVKGGLNVSNMYGGDTGGLDERFGMIFGGYLEYPLAEAISVHGEVLYITKGWKVGSSLADITYSLNYIEIPVMLKLRAGAEGMTGFYIMAGPALGFPIKDEIDCEGIACSVPGVSIANELFEAKGTDWGLVIATGVTVPVDQYTVSMEARGNVGLVDVYDALQVDSMELTPEAKNGCVGFVIGFGF